MLNDTFLLQIPYTGGGLNPAIVKKEWTDHWVGFEKMIAFD